MESFSDFENQVAAAERPDAEDVARCLQRQANRSNRHNIQAPSDRRNEQNFLVHSRLHGRGFVVAVGEECSSATVYSVNRAWTGRDNASLIGAAEEIADVSVAESDPDQLAVLLRNIIQNQVKGWRPQ